MSAAVTAEVGRRPHLRARRLRACLAATAIIAAVAVSSFEAGRGIGSSLALLVGSTAVGGNTLTAGTWVVPTVTWFVHNRPTPPTGNTTAQVGLTMNDTVPTATILYNYDTNADSSPGRRLLVAGSGPNETNTAYYTSWSSAPLDAPRSVSGTASLTLYSATRNFTRNRAGSLIAYLRDYDPGTGMYVEIANGTLTRPNWQGGSTTWVARTISIPVAGYTVPLGHRIEVKVEATSAASMSMWIAYDTMTRPSWFVLP